jgi:hypothetical protein
LKLTIRLLLGSVLAAGTAFAIPFISLTGTTDLVAFNGNIGVDTITLGSQKLPDGCTTAGVGTCTYSGMQSLATGTLTWTFYTPNTTGNIVYGLFGGVTGPTGGTFTASDGIDSVSGDYILNSWDYDGNSYGADQQFQGIDLGGVITVTDTTLLGGSDPLESSFVSYMELPASSYDFTLDVGNCTAGSGNKTVACIAQTDPTAYFNSLDMTPIPASVPEPGTVGLAAAGLLAGIFALRRRRNANVG